jgi:hypothetical protein
METAWPVAIAACGNAAVATVAWGRGRERFVTAIVKATFAFVPDGAMAEIAPEPIAVREQEGAPGTGLRAADDLAPYLAETDVCLTGHAARPRVRFALLRDGAALLDKASDCAVTWGADGAARPAPIVGMGPISKQWPARRGLLGHIDPRQLEGAVIAIPDQLDWRYFQASSSDMRVAALRGDEWILIEGTHPKLDRIMTQLPGARAQAWLAGAQPVDLVLDTLRIDVDRKRCSLTWRRHFPVRGALSEVSIVAGVALPRRPIAWPAFESAASEQRSEDVLGGTMQVEDVDLVDDAVLDEDPLAGTIGLQEGTLAELAARPATPFRQGPVMLAPAPAPPVAHDPLGGTLGLDDIDVARLAARPATPFDQEPSLPESDPLAGTMGLSEGTAAALAAQPATPFRSDITSPLAHATSSPKARSDDDPLGGTMGLDESAVAALVARPVIPFRAIQLPGKEITLPAGSEELDDFPPPARLGAQFLAAMAIVESR